jgi:electron transfer flavoprotein beta subunit
MNIAVPLRLMPNPADELEIEPGATDIDRDYVEMVMNEYDDQALEEAVLVKEATGVTVTALGLGGEGIDEVLRTAAARGADRTLRIDAGELDPYDTRAASAAFAAAIREVGADLVLAGVQTPYDVFGQLAPLLSATLQWPYADVVVGVTVQDGSAEVMQEYAGGRLARLRLTLPAVVGVQSSTSPPRYVSMARLRQAMSDTTIETLSVAGPLDAAASRIVSLARPVSAGRATMLDGDAAAIADQIANLLREKGALMS